MIKQTDLTRKTCESQYLRRTQAVNLIRAQAGCHLPSTVRVHFAKTRCYARLLGFSACGLLPICSTSGLGCFCFLGLVAFRLRCCFAFALVSWRLWLLRLWGFSALYSFENYGLSCHFGAISNTRIIPGLSILRFSASFIGNVTQYAYDSKFFFFFLLRILQLLCVVHVFPGFALLRLPYAISTAYVASKSRFVNLAFAVSSVTCSKVCLMTFMMLHDVAILKAMLVVGA